MMALHFCSLAAVAMAVGGDVTLKDGIEKQMLEKFPELTAVKDATEHWKLANIPIIKVV